MGTRYGGKIVTDGLVLCLDAHDAKSYAGEPTTNVITYTDLDNGWSKSYQSNITYDEIDPPAGITSQVVGHTRGSNSGYWYSYGDYAPQVPSTVYTVSMYVKTLDSNFRIRFYTADNSETGRVWGSLITVPNDGKWHRVVWDSFTNPSNSQSDSLSFNFYYAGAINDASTRTWFCAPQMEAKLYATPFVAGSRSATNGWVDRSGNNNSGTLTNMVGTGASHYRDGQVIMPVANSYLDFDGSNDYITINHNSDFDTNVFTIETWFKSTADDNTHDSLITRNADVYSSTNGWSLGKLRNGLGSTTNALRWLVWGTSTSTDLSGDSTASGNWTQAVGVSDGTNLYLYQNGVQKASGSKPTGNIYPSSYGFKIGANKSNSDAWNGQIAKINFYNKALTAAEVLSNYNATKGRFS